MIQNVNHKVMRITRRKKPESSESEESESDEQYQNQRNSNYSSDQYYQQRQNQYPEQDSSQENLKYITKKEAKNKTKNSEKPYNYEDMYVKYMQQQKDLSKEYKQQQKFQKYQSKQSPTKSISETSDDSYEQQKRQKIVKQSKPTKTSKINQQDFKLNKGGFNKFSQNFYPQKQPTSQKLNQFEPKFIRTTKSDRNNYNRKSPIDSDESENNFKDDLQWSVKTTKEGFLYFYIDGTKTFQWNFPRYYDIKSKKSKPFLQKLNHYLIVQITGSNDMIKEGKSIGKILRLSIYSISNQIVKPIQYRHLYQEILLSQNYTSSAEDSQEQQILKKEHVIQIYNFKLALHHSVSNGHKEFTAILCNFGQKYDLIESQDLNGCTPLFLAVRKNGDTCLHMAAAYNSLDSMIIISNYGGFELLMERNKNGRRPIDIAERMRNYECYQALQKLERNLQYQNAILEREIQYVESKQKKLKKNQINPQNKQSRDQLYKTRPKKQTGRQSGRLKVIQEQSSEDQSEMIEDQSEDEDLDYLGDKSKYKGRIKQFESETKAQQHQRSYINQIKLEKIKKPKQRVKDIPLFNEYQGRQSIHKKRLRKQKSSSSSDIQEQYEKQSRSRLQRMDKSLFKINDQDESEEELKDVEKTKNYFHLSIRDDSAIQNPRFKQLKTARDVFLMSQRDNKIEENEYDDEFDQENQQRINISKKRHRSKTQRDESQPKSIVEKALTKTTSIAKSIGGFFKSGFERLKDYVYQEDRVRGTERIRAKSARSLSRNQRQDLSDSSIYETPRGKSATSRQKSKTQRYGKNQIVPIQIVQQEQSSSSLEDKKQSRYNKKNRRIQPVQEEQVNKRTEKSYGKQENSSSQNKSNSQSKKEDKSSSQNKSGNSEKKSIQIQVDPEPMYKSKDQQILKITKQTSVASLKSIGVGSLNINESSHTPSIYSTQSQRLQHSRMIQKEKKKRLGNKSKMLIQKNYQSSDDENKQLQGLNERSPSPAPRFMKEEIEFYKQQEQFQRNAEQMQNAFQQREINTQQQTTQNDQQPQFNQQFTQQQRQIARSSSKNVAQSNNQRYLRNNSTSPSGTDNPQTSAKQQESPNKLQKQNKQSMKAPILLTQEQFDMIMLNSEEGETLKQPTNNKYSVIESDNQARKPESQIENKLINQQELDQQKHKDIKKFYDDLIRNTSLTQIEETKKEDGTIDDTNLSNLYQRVMNKQGSKQSNKLQSKASEDQIQFNPTENVFPDDEQYIVDFNEFDNQKSYNDMASILKVFEDYEEHSFISHDQPLLQQSAQMQSNVLDKGQFIQNSCMSIYAGKQLQNSSTIQKPLISGMQNNSMQNFNIQYQSDAESDYANTKRGKLGKLLVPSQAIEKSPLKKNNLMIPPLSQKSISNLNQMPNIESDNSARVIILSQRNQIQDQSSSISHHDQHNQNEIQQRQMIELFREDEEEKLIQIVSQRQNNNGFNQQNNQTLAEELKNTFNDIDIVDDRGLRSYHQKRISEQDSVNFNEDGDFDKEQPLIEKSENSDVKNQFKIKLQEEFKRLDQQKQEIIYTVKSRDEVKSQNQTTKIQRKNNRYETEESLINFDLSHSKLDQTDKILSNQNDYDDKEYSQPESRQSLKTQIKQQIQSYVQVPADQKLQQPKPKIEVEVLPLQILKPAYIQNEVQNWQNESYSIVDKDQLKKALLGNMMAQAFSSASSSSVMKKIKRSYLPYQGATASTLTLLSDAGGVASGNQQQQVQKNTPALVLKQSQSANSSMNKLRQSQDSIMQELDSISRIYEDLETVQEEEVGMTTEKTNTLEESKIENNLKNKQHRKIPKEIVNVNTEEEFLNDKKRSQIETKITQDIFYTEEGQKLVSNNNFNTSQNLNQGETDDQASTYVPSYWQLRREEKQNRSTATAFLYNLQTSSEDETKRKSSLLANARPKLKKNNLLHTTSVNAALPLYGQTTFNSNINNTNNPMMQQVSSAIKKSVKDISFRSNNVSVHTEGSDRLMENLKRFAKNKMLGSKKKDPNETKAVTDTQSKK